MFVHRCPWTPIHAHPRASTNDVRPRMSTSTDYPSVSDTRFGRCPHSSPWMPMDRFYGFPQRQNGHVHEWVTDRSMSTRVPKDVHGTAEGCPWDCCRMSMGLSQDVHGTDERCPWDCRWVSMRLLSRSFDGCPWDFHGCRRLTVCGYPWTI